MHCAGTHHRIAGEPIGDLLEEVLPNVGRERPGGVEDGDQLGVDELQGRHIRKTGGGGGARHVARGCPPCPGSRGRSLAHGRVPVHYLQPRMRARQITHEDALWAETAVIEALLVGVSQGLGKLTDEVKPNLRRELRAVLAHHKVQRGRVRSPYNRGL
jgi:hypothetical protein